MLKINAVEEIGEKPLGDGIQTELKDVFQVKIII